MKPFSGHGVGQTTLARYGTEFIKIIVGHLCRYK